MQKYKRNQGVKKFTEDLKEAYQDIDERYDDYDDDYDDYGNEVLYSGCNCNRCVSIQRHVQSMRSYMKKHNVRAVHTMSDMFIQLIFN